MNKESTPIQTINENAHTKIMREMAKYLDTCKESKSNCQCSGVLKYNPNESNKLKQWSFLYQCSDQNDARMEKLTLAYIKDMKDKKEEIYHVKK